MKTYKLQHPETGQILEVEGEEMPSEAQIIQLFKDNPTDIAQGQSSPAQKNPQVGTQTAESIPPPAEVIPEQIARPDEPKAPLPVGNAFDAITEPPMSIASSGIGEGAELLATTGNFLSGDSPVQASQNAEGIADAVSEFGAPQTQAGEKSLEMFGDLMETGMDLAKVPLSHIGSLAELMMGQGKEQAMQTAKDIQKNGFGETVRTRVLEESGSEWLASATAMFPELLGGGMIGKQLWKHRGAQTQHSQELAKRIIDGDDTGELARYIVDGEGKLKKDPKSQAVLKLGLDRGFTQAVNGMPDIVLPDNSSIISPTKQKMIEMTQIKKRTHGNRYEAVKRSAQDVVGESLRERIDHVITVNKQSGADIDVEADKLVGQRVDFTPAMQSFKNKLDGMGIIIDPVTLKVDLSKSIIEDLPANEKAIKRIVKRLARGERGVVPDAKDIHDIKRYIDEVTTYGKSKGGLTGKTEGVIKSLRHDLDALLDENFPDYNRVNETYAETITALDEIKRLGGGKHLDLGTPEADRSLGNLARRIISNAQSASPVMNSITELDKIARKYGGDYNDNIGMLVQYSSELDNMFGSSMGNSFRGEVKGAVGDVLSEVQGDSIYGDLKKVAKATGKKIMSPSDERKFKMLEDFLATKNDPWGK